MPRAARTRVTSPPPGTAPAPSIGCHRSTSLRWASLRYVTITGTDVTSRLRYCDVPKAVIRGLDPRIQGAIIRYLTSFCRLHYIASIRSREADMARAKTIKQLTNQQFNDMFPTEDDCKRYLVSAPLARRRPLPAMREC